MHFMVFKNKHSTSTLSDHIKSAQSSVVHTEALLMSQPNTTDVLTSQLKLLPVYANVSTKNYWWANVLAKNY